MPAEESTQLILTAFENIVDPRVRGRCLYPIIEIIFIAFCAVICGANDWKEIEEFGQARIDWLKKYISLEYGVPSYKTFCRVFGLVPASEFESCFRLWASSARDNTVKEVINIDGKTLRSSANISKGQANLHLINAFATRNGLTLGVEKTPDKSNEIKGIPPLLKELNIENCIITMDAMGCQKGIAKLIKLEKADYVLALKKNHKRLHKKVSSLFEAARKINYQAMFKYDYVTTTADHSRGERREYCLLPVMYLHQFKSVWEGLETIVEVKSIRHTNKGTETSYRYYLTSIPGKDYMVIANAIRDHWHIENRLHWKLDVAFREDHSRFYVHNAAQNLSSLRKAALFYLESEATCKSGIKGKMFKAALNISYLEKVISF